MSFEEEGLGVWLVGTSLLSFRCSGYRFKQKEKKKRDQLKNGNDSRWNPKPVLISDPRNKKNLLPSLRTIKSYCFVTVTLLRVVMSSH